MQVYYVSLLPKANNSRRLSERASAFVNLTPNLKSGQRDCLTRSREWHDQVPVVFFFSIPPLWTSSFHYLHQGHCCVFSGTCPRRGSAYKRYLVPGEQRPHFPLIPHLLPICSTWIPRLRPGLLHFIFQIRRWPQHQIKNLHTTWKSNASDRLRPHRIIKDIW